MAVDKTEPPIKVIITVAAMSLGILVVLRVLFVSYFNDQYETHTNRQIDAMMQQGSSVATASRVREEEARRLTALPAAVAAVSRGERPGSISPTPSADVAALQGWTLLQREVPRPPPAPVVAVVEPAVQAPAPLPAPAAAPLLAVPPVAPIVH